MMGAMLAQASPSLSTEGYFQLGFGPRQSAMGGTGVADGRDAMAAALNPAGIAGMGEQLQIGAALFMPFRGYDGTGTGFIAPGSIDSDANLFGVPNVGYTRPLSENSTLGFNLYGNGGMNTTYPAVANPNCGGGTGVFCGGKAGVDLMQAFMSATYAYDAGALKFGIAPTMVVQRFKATGLVAFSGFSSNPSELTNNGYDYSFGGGLRLGAELELMEGVRLGVAGQTKMWMSKFDDYSGLFEGGGDFDIPAAVTAGLSVDATPDLTVNFDYQHIFYSGIDAVSNPSTVPLPFGSSGGPGFGWDDVDVFKVGAEWRANEDWTLRAGYAYSTNPVNSADVALNILAPGIVKHHITGGLSYKATEHSTLEFSAMFVPASKVSGPVPAAFGGGSVELNMHQFQIMGGWTYDF
jgi:long-chain fatty acid transport protein